MLLKELMRTSGKSCSTTLHYHYKNLNVPLTKPVLDRTEVSPLIKENIEDGHDPNHCVERGQSSHRGKSSIIAVDNHEDEEDENS